MGSDYFLYALIRHAKEIFKENQRFSQSFKDFQRVSEISREIPRFPEKVKSPRDFLRFSEIFRDFQRFWFLPFFQNKHFPFSPKVKSLKISRGPGLWDPGVRRI